MIKIQLLSTFVFSPYPSLSIPAISQPSALQRHVQTPQLSSSLCCSTSVLRNKGISASISHFPIVLLAQKPLQLFSFSI